MGTVYIYAAYTVKNANEQVLSPAGDPGMSLPLPLPGREYFCLRRFPDQEPKIPEPEIP
jgi:hypothetical protein